MPYFRLSVLALYFRLSVLGSYFRLSVLGLYFKLSVLGLYFRLSAPVHTSDCQHQPRQETLQVHARLLHQPLRRLDGLAVGFFPFLFPVPLPQQIEHPQDQLLPRQLWLFGTGRADLIHPGAVELGLYPVLETLQTVLDAGEQALVQVVLGGEATDDLDAGNHISVHHFLGRYLAGAVDEGFYFLVALLPALDLVDDGNHFLLHGTVALAVGHPHGAAVELGAVGFLFIDEAVIRFLRHRLLDLQAGEQRILLQAHARKVVFRPISFALLFAAFLTPPRIVIIGAITGVQVQQLLLPKGLDLGVLHAPGHLRSQEQQLLPHRHLNRWSVGRTAGRPSRSFRAQLLHLEGL